MMPASMSRGIGVECYKGQALAGRMAACRMPSLEESAARDNANRRTHRVDGSRALAIQSKSLVIRSSAVRHAGDAGDGGAGDVLVHMERPERRQSAHRRVDGDSRTALDAEIILEPAGGFEFHQAAVGSRDGSADRDQLHCTRLARKAAAIRRCWATIWFLSDAGAFAADGKFLINARRRLRWALYPVAFQAATSSVGRRAGHGIQAGAFVVRGRTGLF